MKRYTLQITDGQYKKLVTKSKYETLKEAAERLGMHLNTVRKYVDRDDIPTIKLDKAVRIDEQDLQDFVKTHKRGCEE